MSKNIKTVKSLTIKEMAGLTQSGAELQAHMKELAQSETELAAVSGEVTGYAIKPTQFGPALYLVGMFVAQNRRTGEFLKGSKLYLPGDYAEQVKAQFDQTKAAGETVRFSCVIKVITTTKGANGYTYLSEPIRDAYAATREAELLGDLGNLPPLAIAAPKKKTA